MDEKFFIKNYLIPELLRTTLIKIKDEIDFRNGTRKILFNYGDLNDFIVEVKYNEYKMEWIYNVYENGNLLKMDDVYVLYATITLLRQIKMGIV